MRGLGFRGLGFRGLGFRVVELSCTFGVKGLALGGFLFMFDLIDQGSVGPRCSRFSVFRVRGFGGLLF